MPMSAPVQLDMLGKLVKSTSTNARTTPATTGEIALTASTHSPASAARGSWA